MPQKRTLLALLVFSLSSWGDETADRAVIEKAVKDLDQYPAASIRTSTQLFTTDAEKSEVDRFLNIQERLTQMAKQPLSEKMSPRLSVKSIRFITPDAALVDGEIVQMGSSTRRIPLLFILRRDGADWRISAVRILDMYGFTGSGLAQQLP